MKNYILSFLIVTFCATPVFADSESKIKTTLKDIRTVEDVQEARNKLIDRMTEILNLGKLIDERAIMLEKIIARLSNKPLPTQEQIDWRIENPIDISTIKQKKDNLERDLKIKMLQQLKNNY